MSARSSQEALFYQSLAGKIWEMVGTGIKSPAQRRHVSVNNPLASPARLPPSAEDATEPPRMEVSVDRPTPQLPSWVHAGLAIVVTIVLVGLGIANIANRARW